MHLQSEKSLVITLRPLTAPRPQFMFINYVVCSELPGWLAELGLNYNRNSRRVVILFWLTASLKSEYAKRLIPSGLASPR